MLLSRTSTCKKYSFHVKQTKLTESKRPARHTIFQTRPCYWKNLMVISGGTLSIAFRISSAALANLFVSMLIPTSHPGQRMCSFDLRFPIDWASS